MRATSRAASPAGARAASASSGGTPRVHRALARAVRASTCRRTAIVRGEQLLGLPGQRSDGAVLEMSCAGMRTRGGHRRADRLIIVWVIAVALLGGACDGSNAARAPGDSSLGCNTNADCSTELVCYFQSGAPCASSGGACVKRLTATCPQSAGSGCPCLDLSTQGDCPSGNSGAACQGGDLPAQCWICHLPV